MAAVTTYDGLIERFSNNYGKNFMFLSPTTTSFNSSGVGNIASITRLRPSIVMPSSLPTGVSQFIPTAVALTTVGAACNYLIGKIVNLGSLDISGASGTFTDGSNMGTKTEFNTASTKLYSAVLMEVTTALNATPGNLNITYVDQDNNTAETTTDQSLPISAPIGATYFVPLNTGDSGAYDITAAARTGGTTPTGVVKFWGMIPFGIFTSSENTSSTILGTKLESLLTDGFSWNTLGVNDEIGIFALTRNAALRSFGTLTVVGDST